MSTKQPPSGVRLAIPSVAGQRSRVDYAHALARFGFHVFPLHAMNDAGVCTCSAGADCKKGPGKHPRTQFGFKDAVVKPHEVERLWRGAPNANVGIATGPSGLVVIDIDPRHGGGENLAKWQAEHGELTRTLMARTGGGGVHLFYFRPQGLNIGIGANALPGVDWRGIGGYVVAHGSNHKSGGVYEFVDPEMPVAMLDQHVADLLLLREVEKEEAKERRRHGLERIGKAVLLPKSIADKRVEGIIAFRERELKMLVEGERNDKLARSLISLGKLLHLTTFSVESIAVRLEPLAVALDQPPAMVVRLLRFGSQFPGQLPPDAAFGVRTMEWVRESERRLRERRFPRDVIDAADVAPPRQPPRTPSAVIVGGDEGEWQGPGAGSGDSGALHPSSTCWLPHTDLGNSSRLYMLCGEDIRWCETREQWLVWNKVHWAWEETRFVHTMAQRMVEELLAMEGPQLKEELQQRLEQPVPEGEGAEAARNAELKRLEKWMDASFKHAKASQGTGRLTAMEREIKGRPGICIRETDLDCNPYLLGCRNGVLDVRTRTFAPPNRLDYITRIANVTYNPNAKCPKWHAFLADILPDEEVRALVQTAFGNALMGDVGAQRWFLLKGKGSNGKSTLLDTFRELLGEYAVSLPARVLEEQTVDQHPAELMTLVGARFAVGAEPRKGRKWDAERIKGLTGEKKLRARGMYENWKEFAMTAKLFVSANDLPSTNDLGYGFWRRIIVVPFTTIIPPEARKPNLVDELLKEASGILNWALDGAATYLAAGFVVPAACIDETTRYQDSVDDVKRFVEDTYVRDPDGEVQLATVHTLYERWWGEEGTSHKPLNASHLARRLNGLGFTTERRGSGSKKTTWVRGLLDAGAKPPPGGV